MVSLTTIRADRHTGIGGSDAMRIASNDWVSLFKEKRQLVQPADLSDVFPVQLGLLTEQFHLEWIARREGFTLDQPQERQWSKDHDFMFCHLDGWHTERDIPIEAKHTNGRASVEEKARFYMPQLHHTMIVMKAKSILFSAICGNSEPEAVLVDYSQEYADDLIEMEKAFWWHVTEGVEPDITPAGKQETIRKLASIVPVDGRRAYDMSKSNEWGDKAATYLANEQAAQDFEAAKSGLKELVPDDASECSGHGLIITVDKRGAKRFKKQEN